MHILIPHILITEIVLQIVPLVPQEEKTNHEGVQNMHKIFPHVEQTNQKGIYNLHKK